jgi:SAM-dependent methyltransferase
MLVDGARRAVCRASPRRLPRERNDGASASLSDGFRVPRRRTRRRLRVGVGHRSGRNPYSRIKPSCCHANPADVYRTPRAGRRETTDVVTCRQCGGIERQFGPKTARWELRRYRKRGPNATTRILIDTLRGEGVTGASILDVGGGVGAVYHELLASGARDAVHVDVSPDYLSAAREETERRGNTSRVQFVRGDFVDAAPTLGDSDIVTLDRVICCYPDMERLVALSADKARRLLGAVYPREAWWMRVGLAAVNGINRLRRSAFRAYVHPPRAIDAVLRAHGLVRRSFRRTVAWEVVVYSRQPAA